VKVLGLDKLASFSLKHANAGTAIDGWRTLVERSDWKTPHDIKADLRSADFLSGNRVIFNIKGNHYRLLAAVNYETSRVAIEWIGTHADYDKQTFR
jgi:mRNA interferase HigB